MTRPNPCDSRAFCDHCHPNPGMKHGDPEQLCDDCVEYFDCLKKDSELAEQAAPVLKAEGIDLFIHPDGEYLFRKTLDAAFNSENWDERAHMGPAAEILPSMDEEKRNEIILAAAKVADELIGLQQLVEGF